MSIVLRLHMRTSRSYKHCYSQTYCDRLLSDVTLINVPLEWPLFDIRF